MNLTIIALVAPNLLIFSGLLLLLWRQQKTIDLCVWRAFLLKGLNPAIENPEAFGPKAMAEAHKSLRGPSEAPSNFFDEGELEKQQIARWEREAQQYNEALAGHRNASVENAQRILEQIKQRQAGGALPNNDLS